MEIDRYVRHQRAELERRTTRRSELAASLRDRLPALVASLVRRGARRVVLFGSLATETLTEDSDVDVGVEGLPAGSVIDALADAALVMGRPVDLVRIEAASPRLRVCIDTDGEVLFGD